jgi:hypothetical protein
MHLIADPAIFQKPVVQFLNWTFIEPTGTIAP